MPLYAYCIIDGAGPETIASVEGVADSNPYVIQFGTLSVAVSEFEGDAVPVTSENVLAHERVVSHVLTETTPLPFRFGNLASEQSLRSYVETHHERLNVQLANVRDCVEMSVKVIWTPPEVNESSETTLEGSSKDESGTSFLERKRREHLGEKLQREQAEEISAWLSDQVGDFVRSATVNVRPNDSLVVSASHLVERARLEEYRAAVRQAEAARPELHFLTSGAWPPYSFSNISS